jgi:hypothetical protein
MIAVPFVAILRCRVSTVQWNDGIVRSGFPAAEMFVDELDYRFEAFQAGRRL